MPEPEFPGLNATSLSHSIPTFLIAEDNPVNRTILTQMLKKDGYRVVAVENGQLAVDIVNQYPFDVILLDILMPEMDGFQVLSFLKSTPHLRHIPVIMISGVEETESVIRCIEMGAEDYLSKPINTAFLKARISACLEKKRLHDALAETFQKVVKQRDDIEAKNRQIMDSIRYAERIQHAMLPNQSLLDSLVDQYFLIYKPKDIVSGDFYWLYVFKSELITRVFIAVADCTGHGVPGAFMSIIGSTLLNQIVGEKLIHDPALILEHLHSGVQEILGQNSPESTTQDGMDICLCCIEGFTVTFAGAKRPLYVLKPTHNTFSELEEIKGDRKTVGGKQRGDIRRFTNCVMEVPEKTVLYFTTDGIIDQSNSLSERYSSRRLKHVLIESSNLPLSEQKNYILKSQEDFQGTEPQRDDITLLAVQIPLSPTTTVSHIGSFSMVWDINL